VAPNKAAFARVCKELETQPLTLEHVGSVFGAPFYEMVIYLFLDANDAARAIAGAVNRLKEGGKEDLDEAVQ
jgi:hypothetical protein